MSVLPIPAQAAKKFRRLLLLCGLAVLAIPGIASAATVTYSLADLLTGGNTSGGFTIGDKRYSNFTFSSTGPAPLIPRDVNVRVTSADVNSAVPGDDNYTIQFTFGLDAFPGERNDLVIGYQVDVTNPAMAINRVGLRFNGTVPSGSAGLANTSVVESVRNTDDTDVVPGSKVVNIGVQNDGSGPQPDINSNTIAINPTRSVAFTKDIIVSSRPGGGYAAISVVDNIVDQVPEPGTIGLAAFAGAGLLLRRRR